MEIVIIVLGVAVVILVGVLLFLTKSLSEKTDPKDAQFLQNDLANLRRDITSLSQGLDKNLRENSSDLRATFDQKLTQTQTSMSAQLENSRKIVTEITTRLTKLDDTNKRVIDVADELKTLQNVLTNSKQRGNLGEYYLENVLGNVLPPGQWEKQYHFKNGETVDAVVHLKENKILPIDSKFSLEHYNRMIEAPNKSEHDTMYAELVRDLKNRINETSKYIRPDENTMDFAFMFIPSEALYYDTIINNVANQDLIDYAFREKHVIIVSPTTLLAYLQTVMQGLRALRIEEQTKDIQKRVGQLSTHLTRYDDFMRKLGGSLSTTVNHYNNAGREFAKIDKDVVKISGGQQRDELLGLDQPQDWKD